MPLTFCILVCQFHQYLWLTKLDIIYLVHFFLMILTCNNLFTTKGRVINNSDSCTVQRKTKRLIVFTPLTHKGDKKQNFSHSEPWNQMQLAVKFTRQLLHSCRMNPQYPLGWPNSQSRYVQELLLGTMLYFNNAMLSGTITHLQSA